MPGLISGGSASSLGETPGKFSASSELGSIGTFLVCIDLVCSRAATYLTTVKRISTIDYGTGITNPQEIFRNRHVIRPVWENRQGWFAFAATGTVPVRYRWLNFGDFLFGSPYFRNFYPDPPDRNLPTGSWYADPFAKPENHATYLETSFPPLTRSTVAADRYAPTENLIQPGPLFLIARLDEGQSLEFETKVFLEDPFKINPTTPTLTDTIPGDLFPSSSETEIAFPSGSEMKAWMLKIG